jgi:hypothetical protein
MHVCGNLKVQHKLAWCAYCDSAHPIPKPPLRMYQSNQSSRCMMQYRPACLGALRHACYCCMPAYLMHIMSSTHQATALGSAPFQLPPCILVSAAALAHCLPNNPNKPLLAGAVQQLTHHSESTTPQAVQLAPSPPLDTRPNAKLQAHLHCWPSAHLGRHQNHPLPVSRLSSTSWKSQMPAVSLMLQNPYVNPVLNKLHAPAQHVALYTAGPPKAAAPAAATAAPSTAAAISLSTQGSWSGWSYRAPQSSHSSAAGSPVRLLPLTARG